MPPRNSTARNWTRLPSSKRVVENRLVFSCEISLREIRILFGRAQRHYPRKLSIKALGRFPLSPLSEQVFGGCFTARVLELLNNVLPIPYSTPPKQEAPPQTAPPPRTLRILSGVDATHFASLGPVDRDVTRFPTSVLIASCSLEKPTRIRIRTSLAAKLVAKLVATRKSSALRLSSTLKLGNTTSQVTSSTPEHN